MFHVLSHAEKALFIGSAVGGGGAVGGGASCSTDAKDHPQTEVKGGADLKTSN